MPDLLLQAMSAKHSGDSTLAKQLLSQALIQDPYNEAAWMLMSEVVEDIKLRRNCLERVLAINPDNTAASTALANLNTTPLSPITRGEREKPFNPPKVERTPPFTPPFTWDDSQEQYLALGDLTFSEEPGVVPEQPFKETLPTFDWATDSDEPDKTIQKIFNAISNPELASQPLPDTDLSDFQPNPADSQAENTAETNSALEKKLLNELVGPDEEAPPEPAPEVKEEFKVSTESQMGVAAFTAPEPATETLTSDYLLWDNPKAKTDRLVILSNKSLILANPQPTDIPHILGLFTEKKMLRDLLGQNTRMIRLEAIKRLSTDPKTSKISITYQEEDKNFTHSLSLSSQTVRDEVMRAFQIRLGANSIETFHTFKLADKIVPPVVVLAILGFLAWFFLGGLPMLSAIPSTQPGPLQSILSALGDFVTLVGSINILLIFAFLGLLTLLWLFNNLRKPSQQVIVEYH